MPLNLVTEPTAPEVAAPDPQAAPPSTQAREQLVVQKFMSAILAAFSERTVFIANLLFTLAGLASAWLLWTHTLPSPSVLQLIGLGGYAAFLVILELVRRR